MNHSKDRDNCVIYLIFEKIALFLTRAKLPLEIHDPHLLDGPTY